MYAHIGYNHYEHPTYIHKYVYGSTICKIDGTHLKISSLLHIQKPISLALMLDAGIAAEPAQSCHFSLYGLRDSVEDLGRISTQCVFRSILPFSLPAHVHKYTTKSVIDEAVKFNCFQG